MQTMTDALADRFMAVALGHVTREYPHKLDHVLCGPADVRTPQDLHPIFHGSFDWHSCVHGYWMLARLLRAHPASANAGAIRVLFDRMLTADKVEGECRYLDGLATRGFERPYGWAWLLKLAEELSLHDRRWFDVLAPLATIFADRLRAYLPLTTYPVRVGTHANTAFALRLAADYAASTKDAAFLRLLTDTVLRWYEADGSCPAWGEPGGDDFLSPALIEAECMRRLLPVDRFPAWFDRFFPDLPGQRPTALFAPAIVSDRTDGKIAHLDGLNLSRAWCWRALSHALPDNDPRRLILRDAADRHLEAGLPHVTGDYMGEHWLATYATLALLS